VNEIIEQNIYCPRAIAYAGTFHADECGGGIYVSVEVAVALGATNIEIGEDGYGWANWPSTFWMNEKYHLLSVPNGYHIFIGTLDEALADCQARNEWQGTNFIVKSFETREAVETLMFKKLG
jgi:hypothetical protein